MYIHLYPDVEPGVAARTDVCVPASLCVHSAPNLI